MLCILLTIRCLHVNICLESVSERIFQCSQGPHYACEECAPKIAQCPICTWKGNFMRNTLMEAIVKNITVPCQFQGCTRRLYKWDKEHSKNCKFAPKGTTFC